MCADRATLVAEQFVTGSHQEMPNDDDNFQLYPWFDGLPTDSVDELIGPRQVRRLGGVPGVVARRELHMPDLAKPEGLWGDS